MPAADRIAAIGAVFALWLACLPAQPALGHGEEEILLFTYLAEEPYLLRISTALVGGIILAMGSFITYQSRAQARAERAPDSRIFQLMAPGVVITGLGVVILLSAAFVLPDRLAVVHDHPLHHAEGEGREH